ncbi:ArsC/Spx/MgsR family protein [Metabacillus halosaccharovorans]
MCCPQYELYDFIMKHPQMLRRTIVQDEKRLHVVYNKE